MSNISSEAPGLFSARAGWADVVPIQQYESSNPLAPIFYSVECQLLLHINIWRFPDFHSFKDKDATDYFRGIVKKGEKSLRVLELTEAIIRINPAHYSAWYLRPDYPNVMPNSFLSFFQAISL